MIRIRTRDELQIRTVRRSGEQPGLRQALMFGRISLLDGIGDKVENKGRGYLVDLVFGQLGGIYSTFYTGLHWTVQNSQCYRVRL